MAEAQSNFFDAEGYRYGVRFADGSVSQTFNGRTQRMQAEKEAQRLAKKYPRDAIHLVRRTIDSDWVPVYPEPFTLGETVTISRALSKVHETRQKENQVGRMITEHWRVWKPTSLLAVTGDVPTAVGIVIGTRTLMNVNRVYIGYEEGWDNDLSTAERFQAVWVSYDLRRKPVFVLPEDVHRAG